VKLGFFNAGASLTPSPVMATTSTLSWCSSIKSSFCWGDTLAKTRVPSWSRRSSSEASAGFFKLRPSMTRG
jgi:hypothetical protein